jgi:hypothetical protein
MRTPYRAAPLQPRQHSAGSVAVVKLRRPQHPGRVATVALGLLVAANLGWFFVHSTDTSSGREERPEAIEQLFPGENAQAQPQEIVGVDLVDNLQGVIYIDGTRIPEDQYEGDKNLGQIVFRPGPNQEFEALPRGPHNLTIEYWPKAKTIEQATEQQEVATYDWSITVT